MINIKGGHEGERDEVKQRVGVVLDARLKVDSAGVGARVHEPAPSVEEQDLKESQHGVGRRVEVLWRHLPAERHGRALQPVEQHACPVPLRGGVEAGALVVDHPIVLQCVLGIQALAEAVTEERDPDDGEGEHH